MQILNIMNSGRNKWSWCHKSPLSLKTCASGSRRCRVHVHSASRPRANEFARYICLNFHLHGLWHTEQFPLGLWHTEQLPNSPSPWSVTHRPPGLAQSSSVGHVRWRDLYLTINYARCIGINSMLNGISSGRMKWSLCHKSPLSLKTCASGGM